MRTAVGMPLVALAALIAGCRTGRSPDASATLPDDGRAIAAAPLAERCALVATILTGAEARIFFEETLVVKATLTSRDGAVRSFFAAEERCSDRMAVGTERSAATDGGMSVSIDLSESDRGGYVFKATGAVTLAGRIVRDAAGEWNIDGPTSVRRQPRQLDRAPVVRELASALPSGQAEARFEIDTGDDMMGARSREAGLAVVLRYDRRELRQVIASCPEAVRGNALGDPVAPVLDLAGCDGFLRLIHRGGEVVVERDGGDGGAAAIVTSVPVPRDIREVRGPVR